MIITMLAKTETKQSYQDDSIYWYKEYAIGKFESDIEKDEFFKKYHIQEVLNFCDPCVSMRRRIDIISGQNNPHEWDILDCQKDFNSAALNIGDSDYYKGISLNPVHTRIIDYIQKENTLQEELKNLEDKITPHKFQRASNLQSEYDDRFTRELKDNHLYTKVQNNVAPQDRVDAIKNPIKAEYLQELNRVNTRIEEIKKELSELKI